MPWLGDSMALLGPHVTLCTVDSRARQLILCVLLCSSSTSQLSCTPVLVGAPFPTAHTGPSQKDSFFFVPLISVMFIMTCFKSHCLPSYGRQSLSSYGRQSLSSYGQQWLSSYTMFSDC